MVAVASLTLVVFCGLLTDVCCGASEAPNLSTPARSGDISKSDPVQVSLTNTSPGLRAILDPSWNVADGSSRRRSSGFSSDSRRRNSKGASESGRRRSSPGSSESSRRRSSKSTKESSRRRRSTSARRESTNVVVVDHGHPSDGVGSVAVFPIIFFIILIAVFAYAIKLVKRACRKMARAITHRTKQMLGIPEEIVVDLEGAAVSLQENGFVVDIAEPAVELVVLENVVEPSVELVVVDNAFVQASTFSRSSTSSQSSSSSNGSGRGKETTVVVLC